MNKLYIYAHQVILYRLFDFNLILVTLSLQTRYLGWRVFMENWLRIRHRSSEIDKGGGEGK